MKEVIATKFVKYEVPLLEELQSSKAYILRLKLNNGVKLSREEKNWITEEVNKSCYFKYSIPVLGWVFDFSDVLRLFLVSQYNTWIEFRAVDRTALRSILHGRVDRIVEIDR